MEGTPIMQVRRRWSAVAEMPASGRAAVLTGEQRRVAAASDRPNVRNPRYVSPSALLDVNQTPRRFVPTASIDGWCETIRRDAAIRAALLNPLDYEPS
jgi:hypothetical protein